MPTPIHQVDAFADAPFEGNPAAVCFPPAGASDAWLARVAREMNLSETAFLWPERDAWRLRWLTPEVEVDLCGHATLAAAHVLFERGEAGVLAFETRSGRLLARRAGDAIALDFPARPLAPAAAPAGLFAALGAEGECLQSRDDFVVVLDAEEAVRGLAPDFRALRATPARGVAVTARASTPGFDFVSRFFAPGAGIDEDPVTGSAHCALGPYWAGVLGRTALRARQLSRRGGTVELDVRGPRVELRGRAFTVLRGELLGD
ncbi:MAG: PhzF family phenazine biosynthesis protein [Sandaracinaceae bacterium]|nr:PhzF family phenazine biosynthesis protein [Sandaracinaceae bacterium]